MRFHQRGVSERDKKSMMTTCRASRRSIVWGLLLPLALSGCAAFRPVEGVPARYVPDEYRGPSRSGKRTIDLSLLRQTPPKAHRVDSGDVLSVYIERTLGQAPEQTPFNQAPNEEVPPSVGYPVPVREDGAISLPIIGLLPVRGLLVEEVEDAIRRAYTVDRDILKPHVRMSVVLQRPRAYRITVIRQEAGSEGAISQGTLNIGVLKRGTGKVVTLPVYRNDVLNALAESGGLPGLDAENAIYVIRNGERMPVHSLATSKPDFSQSRASTWEEARLWEKPGFGDAVVRAQSPNWPPPAPPAIDPQGDYRRKPVHPVPIGTPPGPNGYSLPPSAAPATPMPEVPPTAIPSPSFSAPRTPMYSPPPAAGPVPGWSVPGQPWQQPALPPADMPSNAMPPLTTGPAIPPSPTWSPPHWPAPMPMNPAELGNSLAGRHIIRIPVRLGPGEVADITESDIILYDGDIVFIEARDTEVFYTGGLLGGGQYSLPRDYDLDVLGAIAIAQGRGAGGGSPATQSVGGQSALNNDVSISASRMIILRPLPDGTQIPIMVDLYAALRDPAERVVIQPGDYLLLQYTCPEAVCAFIERHLLAGALFTVAAAQLQTGGGN